MKKNNKNNKNVNKQKRRILVFLLAFLSIFLITIPTYYGIEYSRNRVTPFVEESAKLKESGYEIIEMKGKNFQEFDFKLICKEFDVTKNYRATYTAEVSFEDKQITNIKMQVTLAANWIKFNQKSSEILLKNSNYNQSTNVYELKPLVEKTNNLLPLPKATTYVLLTYDRGIGANKTKNAYLLEYAYGEYIIERGGYQA